MSADKKRRLEERIGSRSAIISSGARIKGEIAGEDSLRIAGHFEGEIKIEALLWIEKEGKVVGKIEAPYIIIEGEIEGNIVSSRQIEIRKEGRVTGNIKSDLIAMAEGSVVRGEISISGKAGDKPIAFVGKRKYKFMD